MFFFGSEKNGAEGSKHIPIFLVNISHEIPFVPKFFLVHRHHIKIIWGQFEGAFKLPRGSYEEEDYVPGLSGGKILLPGGILG